MRPFFSAASPCFAVALLLLAGCDATPSGTSPESPTPDKRDADAAQTTWDVYYMQTSRIGYGRTTIRHLTEAGDPVVSIEGLNHLAVKRGNDRTAQDIRCTSVETPAGALLRFACEMQMGTSPVRTIGRVHGRQLDMEITTAGKKISTSIPWSPEWGGLFATEQTLLRKPMQPGERRSFKALMAGFNQAAETELSATRYEVTSLLDGPHDLLHIDTVTRFPDGQKLEGALWTDRTGDTLKTFSEAMGMATYRTSEAEALAKADATELDLFSTTTIPLAHPLPNVHHAKQVRYRVHLKGGDPARVFVVGPTQQIQSIDAHTADITVFSIRPSAPEGNAAAPADPPTDADRQPNSMIQSDDPTIVAEARQAAGDETDPWRVAVALERYVHGAITKKDFSQAFATAAEVAKSHEGDCTEHAVFLAALARARGIPARVAIGLVYMAGQQAFGFHMWTEVYVDRRWVPIDGTLALGGIGAGHLKLAQSSLQGASAYSALLPVIQAVGRLRIEVLDGP